MVEKLPTDDNAGSAKEFTPSSDSPVRPLSTSTSVPISLFDTSDALDIDAPTSELQPTRPLLTPPKLNPTLPPTPCIQQSPLPSHIPSIFPGTRTQVHTIIHTPKDNMGVDAVIKEIKVRGVVTTTGDLVKLIVPVLKVLDTPLPLFGTMLPSLFIHTLAAKALIKDREQGTHAFPSSVSVLFQATSAELSINDPSVKELKDLKEAYLEKDIEEEQYPLQVETTNASVVRAVEGESHLMSIAPTPMEIHATRRRLMLRTEPGLGIGRRLMLMPEPGLGIGRGVVVTRPAMASRVAGGRVPSLGPEGGTSGSGSTSTSASTSKPFPASASLPPVIPRQSLTPLPAAKSDSDILDSLLEKLRSGHQEPRLRRRTKGVAQFVTLTTTQDSTPGNLEITNNNNSLSSIILALLGNALKINLSDNVGAFAQSFTLEGGTENENMDGNVGATVLVLVWMGRYRYSKVSGTAGIIDDDDETMDMRIKAEEFKGQFGGGEHAEKRLGELKEGVSRMVGLI
ncbi:hypothetical protein C8J55DRAFT_558112 [Lentinula edodes]|uniref:Uncharacterized protein n=1 Tax=Lentinula lateritia TaxID=40482 RepID=A0A9W9AN52_9AGAR|nr:hypothetical protein C8J55DRAFT_558112 [Lentinula edodes]